MAPWRLISGGDTVALQGIVIYGLVEPGGLVQNGELARLPGGQALSPHWDCVWPLVEKTAWFKTGSSAVVRSTLRGYSSKGLVKNHHGFSLLSHLLKSVRG